MQEERKTQDNPEFRPNRRQRREFLQKISKKGAINNNRKTTRGRNRQVVPIASKNLNGVFNPSGKSRQVIHKPAMKGFSALMHTEEEG